MIFVTILGLFLALFRDKIAATSDQMHFLARKCSKMRLRPCPRPHWGSLQHSLDSLAGFNGPTSKGRGGGTQPVCLLVLTILATGLGWDVGRGEGGEGGVGWRPSL